MSADQTKDARPLGFVNAQRRSRDFAPDAQTLPRTPNHEDPHEHDASAEVAGMTGQTSATADHQVDAAGLEPKQTQEGSREEARELIERLTVAGAQGEQGAQIGPDIVPDSSAPIPNSTDIDPDAIAAPVQTLQMPQLAAKMTQLSLPQLTPKPWAAPFVAAWRGLSAWVDGAAGYDEAILNAYGTPSDHKRRRNIGRAIVVATLVGSLGWLVKISMAFQTIWGIPVAILMATLYGVLSYSMESFFAANVDPFASWWSKALSLTGRAGLSALIAFASALPWVTMSLKSSLHLEMARMQVQEKAALREGVDKANGIGQLTQQTQSLEGELTRWSDSLAKLPATIQQQLDAAEACQTQYTQLSDSTTKRMGEFTGRLAVLAKLEAGAKGDAAKLKAVATERSNIRGQQTKLTEAVSAKKGECATLTAQANEARDTHIKLATEQTQAAQLRLAQMRRDQDGAFAKAREERIKTDAAAAEAASENSSGEFMALVHIVTTQLYAKLLAGLIFMGLFIVDVLPLTLRIFARPGSYDFEKRVDDNVRRMRAEVRQAESELFYDAHKSQVQAPAFRQEMNEAMAPHISRVLMNKMDNRRRREDEFRAEATEIKRHSRRGAAA